MAATVIVGRVAGLYGIRGWVKVFSYTDPLQNIIGYSPWTIEAGGERREYPVAEGRVHGKGVVARLDGFEDRDAAARLLGADIEIRRDRLPELPAGQWYHADLEGLSVVTEGGVALGRVRHLFETGANPVMVVDGERERLVPFVHEKVVLGVDLESGVIRVDWDPEF